MSTEAKLSLPNLLSPCFQLLTTAPLTLVKTFLGRLFVISEKLEPINLHRCSDLLGLSTTRKNQFSPALPPEG